MKYMFASDIHGSAYYCRKMLDAFEKEGAERLVLLGDLLYHGPRNDLPKEYAPKQVIPMLNAMKDKIYAVRGNCEAEVDQMVLEFPVMADYCILSIDGKTLYATHGHVYNQNNLPPLCKGDILILGPDGGHNHTTVISGIVRDASGQTVDYLLCSNTTNYTDFPAGAYYYTSQRLIKIYGWNDMPAE